MKQLFYEYSNTISDKKIYKFSVERNTEQPEELNETLNLCKKKNVDYLIFDKFMGMQIYEDGTPCFHGFFNGGVLQKGKYKEDYLEVIEDRGENVLGILRDKGKKVVVSKTDFQE